MLHNINLVNEFGRRVPLQRHPQGTSRSGETRSTPNGNSINMLNMTDDGVDIKIPSYKNVYYMNDPV